ncbi:TPA: hypothetical protein N3Y94_001945 [Klebsiella quasipneumoniae]|nr:hypothetical protein [Klebsiella quasipneumoniae]HCM6933464.1 hypothetical protein [Klebsiella quasipneumoniae subsp. similipneumoniae]HCM5384721.1 hypothetical protein [Klebsiella quasipneumoniae]HCM5556694.1 hypothetical protein [Klebsiella quasipneumoniae]HCM5708627.1 hypothetical protein [Klebsiella quasipneumoniae]
MLTFPKTMNDDDTPIILQDYLGLDFEIRPTPPVKIDNATLELARAIIEGRESQIQERPWWELNSPIKMMDF